VRSIRYHDQTKHHFNRFARSLGYLDWATQPDPFRRYAGAPVTALSRAPLAAAVPYNALFDGTAPPVAIDDNTIGEFLRCSMGLSAWKEFGTSRWALRVNPSSGNLHPTEAYVIRQERVFHYAPREHALEERCVFAGGMPAGNAGASSFLAAFTSIHWREAWKYGERAFRYCQHDVGHAIGAMRLAAAMLGWRLTILPQWADAQLSALLGVDREEDYGDAEREEVECIAVVTSGDPGVWLSYDPAPLVDAVRRGRWRGRANRLSGDRIEWPIIDEVAEATRYPGAPLNAPPHPRTLAPSDAPSHAHTVAPSHQLSARSIILQRRSALAFDATSALRRDAFVSMLRRLQPGTPPWDAIDWPPLVHLALFVHRVADLVPGIYAYLRDAAVLNEWRGSMRTEFLWEQVEDSLFLLVPIDCRRTANRVSCDQEIAEDGFFSLGMLARFESSLQQDEWFYRRLFWECGLIGQVLYLEAEAVGGRATGIGCFYDDPVHELLGLAGHGWQSLYHFSMGVPVEDARLTSEPGYAWEVG
jgi:SagB-type dehydrogenase family enzyme